jgi:hypothetical protein
VVAIKGNKNLGHLSVNVGGGTPAVLCHRQLQETLTTVADSASKAITPTILFLVSKVRRAVQVTGLHDDLHGVEAWVRSTPVGVAWIAGQDTGDGDADVIGVMDCSWTVRWIAA